MIPKQPSIAGPNHCRPSCRPARSDSSTWASRRRVSETPCTRGSAMAVAWSHRRWSRAMGSI